MVRPEQSSLWKLYDNLPDEFKEDIVVVTRTKNGKDEYGKPTFTETRTTYRGRFQHVDAADRIVEAGGVRATEQARIFLPLRVEGDFEFEDQFDYGTPSSPVPPDPTKWDEIGSGGEVNGEYLNVLEKVATKEAQAFTYGEITARLYATAPPGVGFFFRLNLREASIYPSTGQYILFRMDATESGNEDIFFLTVGPTDSSNFQALTGNPIKLEYIVKIVWTETYIELYLDGVFIGRLDEEGSIMNTPARIEFVRDNFGSNVHRTYYVNAIQISTIDIQDIDHIEARGREWAIMQEPYRTHLQQELLVQEVIP